MERAVPEFVRVSSMNDLADGEIMAVAVNGIEICLARIGDEVYAIGSRCSHELARLDWGEVIAESYELECPLHSGRFDLRSGAPTAFPCVEAVASYAVRVESGEIHVSLTSPEAEP